MKQRLEGALTSWRSKRVRQKYVSYVIWGAFEFHSQSFLLACMASHYYDCIMILQWHALRRRRKVVPNLCLFLLLLLPSSKGIYLSASSSSFNPFWPPCLAAWFTFFFFGSQAEKRAKERGNSIRWGKGAPKGWVGGTLPSSSQEKLSAWMSLSSSSSNSHHHHHNKPLSLSLTLCVWVVSITASFSPPCWLPQGTNEWWRWCVRQPHSHTWRMREWSPLRRGCIDLII